MIDSLREAVDHFRRTIGGDFIRAEGGVAGVLSDALGRRVYLVFKRDWFHSYQNQFPQEEGEGFGQSISLSLLRKAAQEGADVVTVMPDGKIYHLAARDWLEYAELHSTIRTTDRDSDTTASVPSRLLQRIESTP
jgi:hypothetical protein